MKKIVTCALLVLALGTSAFADQGKHLGQQKHSSKHHKKHHKHNYHGYEKHEKHHHKHK